MANFFEASSRFSIDAALGGNSVAISRPMIHLPF